MAELKQVGSIELDQDLDHVRALWRVQRIGWVAMLILAISGILGLFGRGPLAHDQVRASGFTLDYDRFARHGASTSLEAYVEPAALRGDSLMLWVTREYLEGVELESVLPEPEHVEARGDLVLFTFRTTDRSQAARITLNVRPNTYWSQHVRAGLDAGTSVSFRQFIYP